MLDVALLVAALAAPAMQVPFILVDHRIFVETRVNGRGPFAMVVDTGSSGLVITPAVAREARLRVESDGYIGGAGNGEVRAGSAAVADLSLGTAAMGSFAATVIDLSSIRRAIGFSRLDGIIGYEQLRRYRVVLDMDRRRITFSGTLPPLPKGSVVTPFALDGSVIRVDGSVDGVHGVFVVDTGDRSELTLFRPFGSANQFDSFASIRGVVTGYGLGGPVRSDLLLTTLQIFGRTLDGVPTRASLDSRGAFASSTEAGSIGEGLLERYNAVYDYPDHRLVTWPAVSQLPSRSLFAVPSIPPVSTTQSLPRHAVFGAAVIDKPVGVVVSFVTPAGAAAKAGVHVGDVLQSVAGGRVTTASAFYDIVHTLGAGRDIVVEVRRNREPRILHVTPTPAQNESDTGVRTAYETVVVDNTLRRIVVTYPVAANRRLPAVLVIGGIGCYSVDVAANPQDPYMRLTHDITRAGFVTLRLEKSGVGDSQGPPCRSVDFDAETRGYEAALSALIGDPAVDPSRVYLFGHSIGTVIAPRIALDRPVAGVVVAEAVGRDWPEYEIRNLRRELELGGERPADVDEALLEKAQCLQRLLFEYVPETEIERTMPSCKIHNGVYPVAAAYMQQVAHLNVIAPWSQLRMPVLAIYGGSDFVTELSDHQRITDVVNAAHSGFGSEVTLGGMNHLLQRAATPAVAYQAFNGAAALEYDTDLSRAVVAWLCARTECASPVGPPSQPRHQ